MSADRLDELVDAVLRGVQALERIAAAAERTAGTARAAKRSKPRRPTRDAPVDDLTRQRAREMARKSGFRVD